MPSFFLAMVAVLIASIGAKDQMLIADLAGRNGKRPALLGVGAVCAIIAAAAMAWAGYAVAAFLPASGKTMLVAIALIFAALELLWPVKAKALREPTYSLGATAIVLLAKQIGDAARFCIFAFAAATASPTLAGAGGALGGVLAMAIGWSVAGGFANMRWIGATRRSVGAALLIVAVAIGLTARGII